MPTWLFVWLIAPPVIGFAVGLGREAKSMEGTNGKSDLPRLSWKTGLQHALVAFSVALSIAIVVGGGYLIGSALF